MHRRNSILGFILLSVFTINSFAQKDKVLFIVNGEKVYASEFVNVYEKNLSLINDPSQKDLDNYLNLFINYKLKLQEAYQLKMDTVDSYKTEYAKYENQLIQPYLKDENLEIDLLKEAYDRIKLEVNASHILMKIEKNEDTLAAFQKINAIRDRILNGEDFAVIAKEVSEDPSASKNGGNLGYFSAFQMVYPFENKAYQTKVGEISMPFRTQFGYHIIRVHDIRQSKGEVEVAHIMLKGDFQQNKPLIEDIKKQLDQGTDFSELAKNYSQDGGTSKNGGLLPKFGAGRMIPSFESVAFSMVNEGAISEPFQTEFGWHIIKLIKKYPIGSFEEMKNSLKQKIDQGQRAQLMGNSVIKRLLKEYEIYVNQEKLSSFSKPEWEKNGALQSKDILMTIEDTRIGVKDFFKYYQSNSNLSVDQAFNKFKEEKVLDYYKSKLPEKNPELKETMKEYREGLLLFDLMQKRIWDRAEKDTLGLKIFFDSHTDNYKWKERANLTIATLKHTESDTILKLLQNNVESDSIWAAFKEKDLIDIKDDVIEYSHPNFPKGLELKMGEYKIETLGNQSKLYYVRDIIPVENQTLNEVKGKAISDYQDHLEKEWVTNLKQRFVVKVNKKTFKYLKSKYNQ